MCSLLFAQIDLKKKLELDVEDSYSQTIVNNFKFKLSKISS